jgi:hypothetical protein
MTNITLASAEAFDTTEDIRDFCSEQGKGLVTVNQKSIIKKSSSASLHDSLHSINKCNSSFFELQKNPLY